jgi:hypothetical protein
VGLLQRLLRLRRAQPLHPGRAPDGAEAEAQADADSVTNPDIPVVDHVPDIADHDAGTDAADAADGVPRIKTVRGDTDPRIDHAVLVTVTHEHADDDRMINTPTTTA